MSYVTPSVRSHLPANSLYLLLNSWSQSKKKYFVTGLQPSSHLGMGESLSCSAPVAGVGEDRGDAVQVHECVASCFLTTHLCSRSWSLRMAILNWSMGLTITRESYTPSSPVMSSVASGSLITGHQQCPCGPA